MKFKNMTLKRALLIITLMTYTIANAQDTELWRQKGYEAKENGNYEAAISYYSKILKTQPEDYDASLALARLYKQTEKYKNAEKFFMKIFINDSTDVEALTGLSDVYLMTDKLDKSIAMYKSAISFLPDDISLYLKLAKAYSWQGKLQKAINTYNRILKIDNTYSEAYQGIGKMYYWMEKPNLAMGYYEKAIALDPTESTIRKEYNQIKKGLKYQLSAKLSLINEKEESYNIDATIQRYCISKRVNDYLNVSVGFLLDYSNRDVVNTNIGDTARSYDNIFTKISYLSQHHKIDMFTGYTVADSKLSSYRLAWRSNFTIGDFDITNTLFGGYDYFYYWNKVGQTQVQDELNVKYKKIRLSLNAAYGVVDKKPILDIPKDRYEDDVNPHTGYGATLSYQILSLPKILVGASYSYLNYDYKSRYYYSPMGRNLYGPSLSVYYPLHNFYVYANTAYNIGSEYYYESINNDILTNYIDVTNWSVGVEAGYNLNNWEFSVGSSKFYNPFYENFTAYLSIKYSL